MKLTISQIISIAKAELAGDSSLILKSSGYTPSEQERKLIDRAKGGLK